MGKYSNAFQDICDIRGAAVIGDVVRGIDLDSTFELFLDL
jgi:hypothetical protein